VHHSERPRGSVRRPYGCGNDRELEQVTAQALVEPVAEARAYVQTQPVPYMDETGWRDGAQRAWLWVAVTA
jgi:hypothetical protein